MPKQIIETPNAPKPIGPYNQAVVSGNMVFVAGQVALEPGTSNLITGDIKKEAARVMENLKAILAAAGSDFSEVVKTTIFLTDFNHFAAVNEVYGSYFQGNFPARETVEVVALPRQANIEISMIAIKQ